MKKRILALAAAAFVLAAFARAADVTLDVKEHVLSNGMKILMIPKPGVPRVVCHIYFKVGSINERPGITGSAHVHEHLMFKGTEVMGVTDYAKESEIDRKIDELMSRVYREKYWKKDGDAAQIAAWQKEVDELAKAQKAYIIKDDLWTQYMKNGGTGLNASTSQETTGYYVTLPSNKVELQMLMESDRMMNARFREFYSEKDVIMEERRLSENQPGYLFGEQVQAAFYTASPYQWDVIGWMDDLKKMTKQDLVDFHNTYYVPNNAVAIYVGDLDPAAITAMAEKYFGRIPKGPDLEPIRTGVPAQYAEKRFFGEGPAPTSLQMMFHTPPDGDPDTAALSILAGTLGSGGGGRGGMGGGGGTGRLYKSPRPRQAAGRQRLGLEPGPVVRRGLPVQRDAPRRQGRQARGPGKGDLGRDRQGQEGRPDRRRDPEGQEQGRGDVRPQPRQHLRAGLPGRPGRSHARLAVHPDRPRRPQKGHQRRHQARRRQILRQGQQPDGDLHPEVGPVRRTT